MGCLKKNSLSSCAKELVTGELFLPYRENSGFHLLWHSFDRRILLTCLPFLKSTSSILMITEGDLNLSGSGESNQKCCMKIVIAHDH